MSSQLHDLKNAVQTSNGSYPAAKTSTVTGTGIDFLSTEGLCSATQHVGVVSGTNPTLDGKIQESDSLSTGYGDVTGATFTQVTASNSLQVITFQRTKRYLRYVGTIGGTDTPTFNCGVVLQADKKQF